MDFNLEQTVRHMLEPELPVDALAGRQEHVLENAQWYRLRWQSAIQERCRSLESFRLFNGGSRQELGPARKDYHVLAPAVINADKQFLNVKKVEILGLVIFLSRWAEDRRC